MAPATAAFSPVLLRSEWEGSDEQRLHQTPATTRWTDDQIWVFSEPGYLGMSDLRSICGSNFQFSLLHPVVPDLGGLDPDRLRNRGVQAGLEAFGDPPTTTQPPPDANTWTRYQCAVQAAGS